jgi:hypothetical protein
MLVGSELRDSGTCGTREIKNTHKFLVRILERKRLFE